MKKAVLLTLLLGCGEISPSSLDLEPSFSVDPDDLATDVTAYGDPSVPRINFSFERSLNKPDDSHTVWYKLKSEPNWHFMDSWFGYFSCDDSLCAGSMGARAAPIALESGGVYEVGVRLRTGNNTYGPFAELAEATVCEWNGKWASKCAGGGKKKKK